MQQRSSTGNIYDLGYRPYDGARLGRTYAITSLYWYSLKSIFGLGRSTMAKVFPFALAIFALLPALVQIAIAALAPGELELVRPQNIFFYVQVIITLFCAVAAPEILGRDQRARTLTLYFSRALSRADYITAKLGALIASLFLVTFVPQALLLVGNAIAQDDIWKYVKDNASDIPPILLSCLLVAVVMGSISLTIASHSSRRAISTIAVLGYVLISFTLSSILLHTLGSDVRGYSQLISPVATLDGMIYWLFSANPEPGSDLEFANLSGWIYFVASLVYAALSLVYLYRRFNRMPA